LTRAPLSAALLLLLAACGDGGDPQSARVAPPPPQITPPPLSRAAINSAVFADQPPANDVPLNPAAPTTLSPTATADPAVLRAQVLLDRANFSPGVIDGLSGENVRQAIAAYESAKGLPVDGLLDAQVFSSLLVGDIAPALTDYVISEKDVAGPFVPDMPTDLTAMSKLPKLAYSGPAELLSETFHTTPAVLEALNPGVDLTRAGTTIIVPAVGASDRHLQPCGPISSAAQGGPGPLLHREAARPRPLLVGDQVQRHHGVDTNHQVFSSEPALGGITIRDARPEGSAPPMLHRHGPAQARRAAQDRQPDVTPMNLRAAGEPLIRERAAEDPRQLPIGETFDWVDKVSIELTTQMLATLFDFPFEDRRKLTYWSDVATASPGPAASSRRSRRSAGELIECLAYFTGCGTSGSTPPPTT
jgi:peptidoglycan hydrolase-like protein with peptidoglycan-binding domain